MNILTPEAEVFIDALNDLCHEHGFRLFSHSPVYLHPLENPDIDPLDFPEILEPK